jgi:outer membrane protein
MKTKTWITLAIAALAALPAAYAQDDKGDWIIRGRILNLDSANKSDTVALANLGLSVNNKVFPEIDFTYFLSPNWALELVATYPQGHDISSNGVKIGSLKQLPPTLSLQYHLPMGSYRPYFGLGVNYTHFSDVTFDPAVVTALQPSIKSSSTGLAIGAGVDVPMGGGWLFNLDVKKVQIGTDVLSAGTKVGTFKIDPVLFSVGVGKRF